jgi:hypothetical protein
MVAHAVMMFMRMKQIILLLPRESTKSEEGSSSAARDLDRFDAPAWRQCIAIDGLFQWRRERWQGSQVLGHVLTHNPRTRRLGQRLDLVHGGQGLLAVEIERWHKSLFA